MRADDVKIERLAGTAVIDGRRVGVTIDLTESPPYVAWQADGELIENRTAEVQRFVDMLRHESLDKIIEAAARGYVERGR
jgi:hypothetical protein